MRFSDDLVDEVGSDILWRVTPQVRSLTDRLAAALDAAGLPATARIDEKGEPDLAESDPADPVREDVFCVIDVAAAGEPMVAVCEGGGNISTDGTGADEQAEYAAVLRVLDVVAQVTGWRGAHRADLERDAAAAGVGPDGQITAPAQLTGEQLDGAALALLSEVAGTTDRPRPAGLTVSPALDHLVTVLAGQDAATRRTWFVELGNGALSYRSEPDGTLPTEAIADLTQLHGQLGDAASGHPTQVRITVGATQPPLVELRFDSLPVADGADAPPLGWRFAIEDMAARDPEWQPVWLPRALDLLRRAGRQG